MARVCVDQHDFRFQGELVTESPSLSSLDAEQGSEPEFVLVRLGWGGLLGFFVVFYEF